MSRYGTLANIFFFNKKIKFKNIIKIDAPCSLRVVKKRKFHNRCENCLNLNQPSPRHANKIIFLKSNFP